jgi:hypothetical protein
MLYLVVVPLPPGKHPFAVQLSDNNKFKRAEESVMKKKCSRM